jgi:hypothetical protein
VVKHSEFNYDPSLLVQKLAAAHTRQRIIWQCASVERVQPGRAGKTPALPSDGPRTATIDRIPDPAVRISTRCGGRMATTLRAAALIRWRAVSPKQYQMFDLRA